MTSTRRPTPVGTAVALAALLAAAAYVTWVETREPGPAPVPASHDAVAAPETQAAPAAAPSAASGATGAPVADPLVMRDQHVRDERGRLIFEGDVDLRPVFARIAAGQRDRHRNDGTVFANREGRLPRQPRGYYTEWVVRTAGAVGVGPQRVITGRDGDAWYTPDHYETFVRVRPPS